MSNIEFVLSLTPEQIYKFIEFNTKPFFLVGILKQLESNTHTLYLNDTVEDGEFGVLNLRYSYKYNYINNKWEENYE